MEAMQSGIQGTKMWKMDWDTLEKDNRWTNPLMGTFFPRHARLLQVNERLTSIGWASSGDFMQGTTLKFASQEDAIAFAEKQGWDYFLQTPHKQEFHPKSYSSNFTRTQMNPKKSKVIRGLRKVAHTDAYSCTHQVKLIGNASVGAFVRFAAFDNTFILPRTSPILRVRSVD